MHTSLDEKDEDNLARLNSLLQGDMDCLASLIPGGKDMPEIWRKRNYGMLRHRWIEKLVKRNGMSAVPILIGHLNNPDKNIRILVTESLYNLSKKSKTKCQVDKLLSRKINIRRKAMDEIKSGLATGKYDRNLVIISLAFSLYGYDARLIDTIVDLICEFKDDRTIEVLKCITEWYYDTALLVAVKAIRRMDKSLFTRLLIDEPDDDKRHIMLYSIDSMPEMRLYATIGEILRGQDARNRANALHLLPYLNRTATTKMLLEALSNKDKTIRARSAVALCYGNRIAIGPLTETLNDPCSSVRAGAAFALGCICPGNTPAMGKIKGLLSDRSGKVRRVARRVLMKSAYS